MAKMSVKHITDLPIELQRTIFTHSHTEDLIALALVSKHFHRIASAQLYRTFSILFSDEDDPTESTIDSLATGLDTLVTSQYDYAQYLREIVIDSWKGGDKGERVYRQYSYDYSCGKFMSTLLQLALRRAPALETFRWNIRVELSRAVLKELHSIKSLRNLHIRLQSGPSLYKAPPPLNSTSPMSEVGNAAASTALHNLMKSNDTFAQRVVSYINRPPPAPPAPPTFSGFRYLKSLAVLDMDTLEYVSEIAACVQQCSPTLEDLNFSLSESLAMKARTPLPEDTDESEDEIDDFDNGVATPPLGGGPLIVPEGSQDKEERANSEKTTQDGILAKLFGLDKVPEPPRKPDVKWSKEDSELKAVNGFNSVVFKQSIDHLLSSMELLVDACDKMNPQIQGAIIPIHKSLLNVVSKVKAGKGSAAVPGLEIKIGESSEQNGSSAGQNDKAGAADGASTENIPPPASQLNGNADEDSSVAVPQGSTVQGSPEAAAEAASSPAEPDREAATVTPKPIDTIAEDIDLDHPDVVDDDDEEQVILEQCTSMADGAGSRDVDVATNSSDAEGDIKAADGDTKLRVDFLLNSTPATTTRGSEKAPHKDQNTHRTTITKSRKAAKEKQTRGNEESVDSNDAVKDYVRSTRKLALKTFSLYLIPLKTSVLHRAIDVSHLHSLTLLNVGPQAPFWNSMTARHQECPLKLRSIYTDDVRASFLLFVAAYEGLSELFLLERSSKSRTLSFDEVPTVGIDQIRRMMLRKHMRTLKKLMIKNENDISWDIDDKTMSLLTRRGGGLTELGISLGLNTFHHLLQYFPGLVNLRALHILKFRMDDTCTSVKKELRKFAIDTVAHYPHMQLEYFALEDTLDAIVRPDSEEPTRKKEEQHAFPWLKLGQMAAAAAKDAASSDESDHENEHPCLKVKPLTGMNFWDVESVRIFRKDIRAGKL